MGVTHALTPELKAEAEHALITTFFRELEPYLDLVTKRDQRFFLECSSETLRDVDLKSKWLDPTVDADTREAIWEYVSQLVSTAQMHNMYDGMSPELIEQMQRMAKGIVKSDGGIDIGAIDLSNLEELGQSILSGKSPAEAEAFTQSMLKNATSVFAATAGGGGAGAGNPAAMLAAMTGAGGGGVADIMSLAMGASRK